ncbi:uncharacterized protein LOC134815341 isoform X3 [Bolinopsis microptera]|uniref:uncharacterized protein LOC134815341 isoform X3 n=1 Tax=Bolinopsis microptera TaxID=2820187 RepID=UPI00307AB3C2
MEIHLSLFVEGKNKLKSIMCAVGVNNQHSLAGKHTKVLYPHQYPLQELGEAPKVEMNSNDGLPRVTNSYLYVSPRDAQELTIFYRRKDGNVQEETLSLRPSATAQEIIDESLQSFDELDNDPLAYRLIMKAYEFDEKTIGLEDQPLVLLDTIEDCQEGYPQIWIEDQEIAEVSRSNSFVRKHSSRRASRKKARPTADPITSTPADTQTDIHKGSVEKPPPLVLEESKIPRLNSTSEISKIQSHLHHTSLRRKTQSTKSVGEIKAQESDLKSILMEQEKVISALNNAVSNAESISPQSSVKDVSPTKLKEALAEKQTQIWELEENQNKDREALLNLTTTYKVLEGKFKDQEEKFRQFKLSAKNEVEMEKREKREAQKEVERLNAEKPDELEALYDQTVGNDDLENRMSELKLQVDKDQEIIDITTNRNAELKDEIRHLKNTIADLKVSKDTNKLEVDGLQRSGTGISDSISINDFTEWSKDLDDLKKRNDQLLFRNKQLSSDNIKLTELIDQNKSTVKQAAELKGENRQLKDANEELNISVQAKEAEIASLNERIQSSQDQDGSFDEYQEKYYDLYEQNQRLESVMSGTIEKLRSKLNVLEDDKVQLQNTINGLNTGLEGKKRQLKEYDYMKNRVEMMEMEHTHLKEFSSQLIDENKAIDGLNKTVDEKEQKISELDVVIQDMQTELIQLRGLEKVNCAIQVEDPRIEELESRVEEALGKIESRNAVVENMNHKLTQREEEVSNLKGMATDFENTNELLTAEIDRLKKHNASLESKGTKKTDEIASFKMIIDALNEQISSSKSLCEDESCPSAIRLKDEHVKKEVEMESLLKDSQINFNNYSSVTGELAGLQSKYDELQDDFSILEADKTDAEETVKAQEKSIEEKSEKITDLMDLNSSLRDEVDRGNEKFDIITSKRDELASELTQARLKKADTESELNQVQDEVRAHQRKVKQSRDQAESLQNLNDALTAQLHEMKSNDCSEGKCAAVLDLSKTVESKEQEKAELSALVEDLRGQRKDLQNVVIKSKNDLAESQIDYQEMEATYLEAKEQADSFKGQIRGLQRRLDPKKKKDHIDNLENQVEMYQCEVMSLKSVTRAMEDEVEKMSIAEQDNTDVVQRLNKKNSSLEIQLGDAKGEIYDLEQQLEKFTESLRSSQEESATVEMYLSERQMLKDTIGHLEKENKELSADRDGVKSSLTSVKEELSIVKGVRDIQTRDSASTLQTAMRSRKTIEVKEEEINFLKEEVEAKTNECSRQVDIIERHRNRTRDLEIELKAAKNQLVGGLTNGIEIESHVKSAANNDDPTHHKLDGLNSTIADLSSTLRSLTTENLMLETSISEMNEEEQLRQNKIAELEASFHEEVEHLHEEYKSKICTQTEEIKKWINQNKILSEEILMLEQDKEDLEKMNARGNQIPDHVEMQDALQEVTKELNVQGRMAQKSQAQLEEAQQQNENLESEMMAFKKKCVAAEKTIDDLSMRLQENDITVDEYKQRFEDLQTADENKRTEIRLLNKMVKEYSNKAEESEHDFVDLKGKYKEKKHHIEELQKELVLLRSQNAEYENVIVALESTNATDTIDNSSKSRRINELQSLLTETEGVANQKATELETTKQEISRLHEENEQMLEEVKSYQDEWRRLTSLLSNVNHTNHANMDSCKRLETKLDDIEYKVSETNVHIDVCQGDMFSKTEALVRENSLLEQKIAEKSYSIEQSDKFLKESHDNISLLQNTMAELQDRIEELQGKPSTPSNPGTDPSDLTGQIQALSDELEEKNELLLEAKIEKESDESAFKVSLDTIVRSYEDKVESLISESEQKDNEIQKLKIELESR